MKNLVSTGSAYALAALIILSACACAKNKPAANPSARSTDGIVATLIQSTGGDARNARVEISDTLRSTAQTLQVSDFAAMTEAMEDGGAADRSKAFIVIRAEPDSRWESVGAIYSAARKARICDLRLEAGERRVSLALPTDEYRSSNAHRNWWIQIQSFDRVKASSQEALDAAGIARAIPVQKMHFDYVVVNPKIDAKWGDIVQAASLVSQAGFKWIELTVLIPGRDFPVVK